MIEYSVLDEKSILPLLGRRLGFYSPLVYLHNPWYIHQQIQGVGKIQVFLIAVLLTQSAHVPFLENNVDLDCGWHHPHQDGQQFTPSFRYRDRRWSSLHIFTLVYPPIPPALLHTTYCLVPDLISLSLSPIFLIPAHFLLLPALLIFWWIPTLVTWCRTMFLMKIGFSGSGVKIVPSYCLSSISCIMNSM